MSNYNPPQFSVRLIVSGTIALAGLLIALAIVRHNNDSQLLKLADKNFRLDDSASTTTHHLEEAKRLNEQSVEEAVASIRSLDAAVRSNDRVGALELLKALATTHASADIRALASARYAQAARQSQNEQELQAMLEVCLPVWNAISADPDIWKSHVVALSPLHVFANDLALTLLLNQNDADGAVRVYQSVWDMREHLPKDARANATQNFASFLIASKQNQKAADVVWTTLTEQDVRGDDLTTEMSLVDRYVSIAMSSDVVLSDSQAQTVQAWSEQSDFNAPSLAVLVSENHSRNGRSGEAVEAAFFAYSRLHGRDAAASSRADDLASQWEEHLLSRMQSGSAFARPDIELFALNEMLKRPRYAQSASAIESRISELTTILIPQPKE